MKRHLPNALTCLNLLCGCLALTYILAPVDYSSPHRFDGLVSAAWLVGLAAVADFLDGLVARALRVSSAIGKDLDSLADMVSFGVVPGAILAQLLVMAVAGTMQPGDSAGAASIVQLPFAQYRASGNLLLLLPYLGFVVSIFSALRLAKFNNDTRQTTSFIGLPTPACTLLVASLPLILSNDQFGVSGLILNPWVLVGLAVLLSGLLVAELPLFALKFKTLRWADNRRRFLFLLLTAGLLLALGATAVPLVVLLYVLLSVPKSAAR